MNLVEGVVGITKAAIGVGYAEKATIEARRDSCRICPEATKRPDPDYPDSAILTSLSRCRRCHCFLAPKTVLSSSKCPNGRW